MPAEETLQAFAFIMQRRKSRAGIYFSNKKPSAQRYKSADSIERIRQGQG